MDFICGVMSVIFAALTIINFFCLYGEKDLERQRNLIKLEIVLFSMFVITMLLSKIF